MTVSYTSATFAAAAGNIVPAAAFVWAVLFRGQFLRNYPSKLHFTTLQNFYSTFQSFFVAVMVEWDFSRWKLGLNLQLLTVAYCGVFVARITYYLQAWCIEKKGPVFVAVFMPLSLVLTTILLAFILGEGIHLGSIVGGILMIVGPYCVLWGRKDGDGPSKSAAEEGKACFQDDEIAVQINH